MDDFKVGRFVSCDNGKLHGRIIKCTEHLIEVEILSVRFIYNNSHYRGFTGKSITLNKSVCKVVCKPKNLMYTTYEY